MAVGWAIGVGQFTGDGITSFPGQQKRRKTAPWLMPGLPSAPL
jgi:hypothetical protein